MAGSESIFFASEIRRPSRGEETELLAIKWLVARGFQVISRRLRTPYAEVDLLIRNSSSKEWLVVEVKSSLWPDGQALGLSQRQRARLWRASRWLEDEISRVLDWHGEGGNSAIQAGSEVRLSLVLMVREDGLTHRTGFRILPIF